jgi:hypothetical protein
MSIPLLGPWMTEIITCPTHHKRLCNAISTVHVCSEGPTNHVVQSQMKYQPSDAGQRRSWWHFCPFVFCFVTLETDWGKMKSSICSSNNIDCHARFKHQKLLCLFLQPFPNQFCNASAVYNFIVDWKL